MTTEEYHHEAARVEEERNIYIVKLWVEGKHHSFFEGHLCTQLNELSVSASWTWKCFRCESEQEQLIVLMHDQSSLLPDEKQRVDAFIEGFWAGLVR